MTFPEYARYDGMGLAELVRRKEVTPLELVEACLERIDRHNPRINAVIYRMDDRARAAARAGLPGGPFCGVPFLLKDALGEMRGVPTTMGSRALGDRVSDEDCELVTRYLGAGVNVVGKANCSELAIVDSSEPVRYGPTRNPWNVDLSPGGSSGGSAAAVAAGMVPMAHGNDIGGSIRIPSACCGLVGLKPTRGRNPLGPGYGDLASGLLCEHVLTRTVRDSAAMLDATAGPAPGDPYLAPPPRRTFLEAALRDPGRLRIGFSLRGATGKMPHPDCAAAVRGAAALCQSLGHEVEEAGPEYDMQMLDEGYAVLFCAHVSYDVTRIERLYGVAPSPEVYENLTLRLHQHGSLMSAADYQGAVTAVQLVSRQVARFFQGRDIWMAPAIGHPPPPLGSIDVQSSKTSAQLEKMADFSHCNLLLNATGQPAVSLPLHWNGDGLPIGVELAARYGEEETLLSLAAQLEEAAPWSERHPPVWG